MLETGCEAEMGEEGARGGQGDTGGLAIEAGATAARGRGGAAAGEHAALHWREGGKDEGRSDAVGNVGRGDAIEGESDDSDSTIEGRGDRWDQPASD